VLEFNDFLAQGCKFSPESFYRFAGVLRIVLKGFILLRRRVICAFLISEDDGDISGSGTRLTVIDLCKQHPNAKQEQGTAHEKCP
jgi:hypothetical protein